MFCCPLGTCILWNLVRKKQVAPCSCGHSPYIDLFIMTIIHLFVARTLLSEIDLSRASSAKGRNEWSCTPSPLPVYFSRRAMGQLLLYLTWRDDCSCLYLWVFSLDV